MFYDYPVKVNTSTEGKKDNLLQTHEQCLTCQEAGG